jgi:hypothetical protein
MLHILFQKENEHIIRNVSFIFEKKGGEVNEF